MDAKEREKLEKEDALLVVSGDEKSIMEHLESISHDISERISETRDALTEIGQQHARINQILIVWRIEALKAATESQ